MARLGVQVMGPDEMKTLFYLRDSSHRCIASHLRQGHPGTEELLEYLRHQVPLPIAVKSEFMAKPAFTILPDHL